MLDRAKVVRALELVSDKLFLDLSSELRLARETWNTVCVDLDFLKKVSTSSCPWPVPLWQGALDQTFLVDPYQSPYYALGVDGSQIYPDKHQGISCFLINVGTVLLPYRSPESHNLFFSEPHVFAEHTTFFEGEANAIDVVNCKREEFELEAAVEQIERLKNEYTQGPIVFLFDGSLIFWHLESKEQTLKDYFLHSYCSLLHQLRHQNVPMAGYISLPKSKELVNIVRAALCNFLWTSKEYEKVAHINDAHIVSSFLGEGERTILFQSQSPITHHYPEEVRPYFFYLNGGAEIARVEVPAYVAHDPKLLNIVCSVIMDQIGKGRGYPVVVAEAHEQAVVKGVDREIFYRLLEKFSIQLKRHVILSQKAAKKKNVTV